MFHILQKKIVKKIRNKGTINVLQGGGGVSGVWSKTIKLPFFLGPFPKTLSREGHSRKKSCVSETVIEICGKIHNFFSDLLLLPKKIMEFLFVTTIQGYSFVFLVRKLLA